MKTYSVNGKTVSISDLKRFLSGNPRLRDCMICKEVWKKWGIDTTSREEAIAVAVSRMGLAWLISGKVNGCAWTTQS